MIFTLTAMLFLRALIAFLVLPCVFGGLMPWWIVSADRWKGEGLPPGIVPLIAGVVIVLWCVRDFYVQGRGTLAPWDPPKNLVTRGLYQFTRNPMYVGVLLVLCGWAAWKTSPLLAIYTVVMAIAFHLRVILYEEPRLNRQFPEAWFAYSAKVPRWLLHFRRAGK
jgi:protein-S-isoprenylcysteine O-methyltransferase Ste14